MNKLYLIDGMSIVFRAYHAMSRSGLKTPSGEPSSAVFAFVNILTSLLEKEKPEHIAVVFDTAAPTFRHEMYPLYKANRDAFPEELVPQLGRIKEFLDLISVPRIELPGFEADDIIGTLSAKASDNKTDVVCLTSDKDYYQLVNEHVKLYKPARQTTEDFDIVGIGEVFEKFGVTPPQVIDVLALIGDTSDNVPGVKGIGDKTAIPLIQKFGSVEGLYDRISEVEKESVRQKLIDDRDKAFLAKKLVTIKLDVPLSINYDELDLLPPKFKELDAFFALMGFNTLRKKWNNKAVETGISQLKAEPEKIDTPKAFSDTYVVNVTSDAVPSSNDNIKSIDDVPHDYILADSFEIVNKIAGELSNSALISLDLETSGLDRDNCRITGIAISVAEGKGYYIPVYEYETVVSDKAKQVAFTDSLFNDFNDEAPAKNNNFQGNIKPGYLPVNDVLKILKPYFEDSSKGKCGQNIKFDAYILKRYGVEVSPITFDSMLASYLLNPDLQHNLDALSLQWLNYRPVPITSLIGEKKSTQLNMEDVPPEKICPYASEDADLALKLRNVLFNELKKENLLKLAEEIEFPLVEVLIRMEAYGVSIDTKSLSGISSMIEVEAKQLREKIFAEAGEEFNIDSPKQLAFVLFEKMMIPSSFKNKTGFSTNVQVLSQLAEDYPIANMILDYRQLVKLKSTYVDALPKLINQRTGRIHTSFNQTIASTGRLSSTDPNLQNIPIRTDLGKEIRKAFVPKSSDRVILSADYSQIELRIMAFMSEDLQLIEAFKNGKDIHAATAAGLYDIPIEQVDSNMRRVAKTVNFGIMYGLGAFGLSQRLNLPRKEAQSIIDNYFKKYPGIKNYFETTLNFTRKHGYSETLCGRRRYFPNINSKNGNLRSAEERAAINMPVQGTAADMMKIAMINIDREIGHIGLKSMMIIQVHDELVFEVYRDEVDELTALVKDCMESALKLGDVPVVVEAGTGDNWFLAH